MSDDPKFNPYRKKALEQGMKDGWDFSGFMSRPADEKIDKDLKVAQSLQTILRKTFVPNIPHAPNFAQYLYETFGDGVCCNLIKEGERIEKLSKDTYMIMYDKQRLGLYMVWTKEGNYHTCVFEGRIQKEYIKLKFQQSRRRDENLGIPFP